MKKVLLSVFSIAMLFSACSKDDESTPTIAIKQDVVSSDSIAVIWTKVDGALFYTCDIALKGEVSEEGNMTEGVKYTFDELLADKEYDVTISAGKSLLDEAPFAVGTITIKTAAVNAALVGVWKYPSTVVEKYDLKADGTGVYTYSTTTTNLRWKTIGKNLIITKISTYGSYESVYPFELSDPEVLTLTGIGTYLKD